MEIRRRFSQELEDLKLEVLRMAALTPSPASLFPKGNFPETMNTIYRAREVPAIS